MHLIKYHLDKLKSENIEKSTRNKIVKKDNHSKWRDKIQCLLCPDVVTRMWLRVHMREHHSPEVPLKCDHCEFRSHSQTGIKAHATKFHTPGRPGTLPSRTLPCPNGCGNMFGHKYNVTAHVNKACRLSPQADVFRMHARKKKRARREKEKSQQ